MNPVGLTQVFSHEQGLTPESFACILCLRYLKATDSHSITAFSLNQEPALTAHDTMAGKLVQPYFTRYPERMRFKICSILLFSMYIFNHSLS